MLHTNLLHIWKQKLTIIKAVAERNLVGMTKRKGWQLVFKIQIEIHSINLINYLSMKIMNKLCMNVTKEIDNV